MRYRDGGRTDTGLAANSSCHSQRLIHNRVQSAVQRAHAASGGVGLFHLAENLRLADDHRLNARSDAEKVPDHFLLPIPVEVVLVLIRVVAMVVGEEIANDRFRLREVSSGDRHFDSIARGNDERFENTLAMDELCQSCG